jgi:hypothetical protein
VSSREWVKADEDKGYTSGDKDLPTLESRVFVMMPTGDLDGCFVLCSGYVIPDTYEKFKEDDGDDTEKSTNFINVRRHVWPGNWKGWYNYVTGRFELQSPDEKTTVLIDYPNEEGVPEVPELHAKLFEKLLLDILEGKTIDLAAWEDDIVFNHNTEKKTQSLSLFDQIKITIEKDKVISFSSFDELFVEHKKGEYTAVSVFDELQIEHHKGEKVTVDLFDELSIEHKKGDSVSVKMFDELTAEHKKGSKTGLTLFGGEASVTHTKGVSTVIKSFDSEITLKQGMVTIKTSAMITHDVPTYKFTGNTSVGRVSPKGTGVYCAIPVCPFSGLPQTG